MDRKAALKFYVQEQVGRIHLCGPKKLREMILNILELHLIHLQIVRLHQGTF